MSFINSRESASEKVGGSPAAAAPFNAEEAGDNAIDSASSVTAGETAPNANPDDWSMPLGCARSGYSGELRIAISPDQSPNAGAGLDAGLGVTSRERPAPVRGCQWIEGLPSRRDDCKCGAPTEPGSSFCPEHRAIAYVPVDPMMQQGLERAARYLARL